MRALTWGITLILVSGAHAEGADAVTCVQQELSTLGYEVGMADGVLGVKTKSAAASYASQLEGWELAPLDPHTAFRWCRRLAADNPSVRTIYHEYLGTRLPAFDPGFNLIQERSYWLFDEAYYLAQVPDASSVKVARVHYNTVGWKLGYDPSLVFDTSAYLEANPDVADSGMTPLYHYITKGMDEGRGFGLKPDESGFIFDVGPNVPDGQVALIKRGLVVAQDYFSRVFSRPFPPDVAARIIVKVEATGKGNQEQSSNGGSGATGLSGQNDLLPRPYFDIAHTDWRQDTRGRGWTREDEQVAMVVHEVAHGWQNWLGALTVYEQPLGDWVNEGIANYIGWEAAAGVGLISIDDYQAFSARAARDSSELDYPLEAFGTSRSPVWAGHVGYLAVDWLVDSSPNREMSLMIIADELAAGRARNGSVREAFLKAFGLEIRDFYEQFEPWRKALRANPKRALANRPTLLLEKDLGERPPL